MSTTTFKGARYVPKFYGVWTDEIGYEAIGVVKHNAFTYISKQPVPEGVPITNTDFWLLWADPNAQMEELRQLVMQYVDNVEDLSNELGIEIEARKIDIEKAHVFETVADMKQGANLSAGAICHTNGFHTSGDGGAAWYVITDTGTTNEMDVIACGALFANLIIDSDSVTPEMFGAWGDGTHDDTNAFNRAIEIYPIINCGEKIYGIHSVNLSSRDNVLIEGNGCTFLNIKTDLSDETSIGTRHSSAMLFYSQGTTDNPNGDIVFNNCTLDGNSRNIVALPQSIQGLSFCTNIFYNVKDVIFNNVENINSFFTDFFIVTNGLIKFSGGRFENISNETLVPYGSSRNCFEIRTASADAQSNHASRVIIENMFVKDVFDMLMRQDNQKCVSVKNCIFKNIGCIFETHADVQNYNFDSIVELDNCHCENIRVIGGCGSPNAAYTQKFKYVYKNSMFINISSCIGAFEGENAKVTIDNCYMTFTERQNHGLIMVADGAEVIVNNSFIDYSAYTNNENCGFISTLQSYFKCAIKNCVILSSKKIGHGILRTNISTMKSSIILENNYFEGVILGACVGELLMKNNIIKSDIGNIFSLSSNSDASSVILDGNNFETAATSTGWIEPFSIEGTIENLTIANNTLETVNNNSGTSKLGSATKKMIIHDNAFKISNSNANMTIPSGCIAIIHDNKVPATYTGTATIAHDNVGITINPE